MSSDSCCCLHLLKPVIEINMDNAIVWRVHVWITLTFIILNLKSGWYSLLTEGDFIPSTAANNEFWYQVKLISMNCIAHHLG